MKLNNNKRVYIKILSYYRADLEAPFPDGSKRSKRFLKEELKQRDINYGFLKDYIGTDKLLEVSDIYLAERTGSSIDSLKKHRVSVFDDSTNRLYSFYIGEPGDGSALVNDMYNVEFIIKEL